MRRAAQYGMAERFSGEGGPSLRSGPTPNEDLSGCRCSPIPGCLLVTLSRHAEPDAVGDIASAGLRGLLRAGRSECGAGSGKDDLLFRSSRSQRRAFSDDAVEVFLHAFGGDAHRW
jgi:hypothetical protein